MSQANPKKHSIFTNLLFNIVIPVVILTKFNAEDSLGPMWAIVVALAFPIGYGLWELKQSGEVNKMSILGIVSIFLTGGMSLLKLPPEYIAIKEAAVPGLIGIAVIVSQFTKYPLLRTLLINDQIVDVHRIHVALNERGTNEDFRMLTNRVSYMLAGSFFLSSALNYGLAKYILVAEPGTPEYTQQLGEMTALSYPVIAIPSMIVMMAALWYLLSKLQKITGLELEEMMANHG